MADQSDGYNKQAPIIIGGIGGSGTRLVAEILQASGVHLGTYLNAALDNVFFARLITKDPSLWEHPDLDRQLRTFTRLYFGKLPGPADLYCLWNSAVPPRHQWVWLLLRRSQQSRSAAIGHQSWGWKNPRSQFFLRQLSAYYPQCSYIHVIRHGLDMAYSSNTGQFERWGPSFKVDPSLPVECQHLDFWIAVNTWVSEICNTHLPGRHFWLRFDALCDDPAGEIDRLLSFLQLERQKPAEQLAQIVQKPASIGRHRHHSSFFTDAQLHAVRQLGFDVIR